jgi:hypothetical protein
MVRQANKLSAIGIYELLRNTLKITCKKVNSVTICLRFDTHVDG